MESAIWGTNRDALALSSFLRSSAFAPSTSFLLNPIKMSSSLMSIPISSNPLPLCCNSKTPIISIPKTLRLSPNFKPHFSNFPPLFRSPLISPNFSAFDDTAHAIETPESELSEIEEEHEESEKLEDEVEEIESESLESGRLYVGNLPYTITNSELSQVFGEAGNVVSVEIVYDRITDRSRGFAFVTMASVEEAKEAIRMFDGSQVGGRTMKVNFPEVPRGGEREVMGPKIRSSNKAFIESPNKIYAGNLSWIITSEKLKEAFADQPGFLSAKVIYEKHSGRSRGFGFITFGSPEAAESALSAMNGVEVEGRPLRLNLAAGRVDVDSSRSLRPGRSSEINVDESEIFQVSTPKKVTE